MPVSPRLSSHIETTLVITNHQGHIVDAPEEADIEDNLVNSSQIDDVDLRAHQNPQDPPESREEENIRANQRPDPPSERRCVVEGGSARRPEDHNDSSDQEEGEYPSR